MMDDLDRQKQLITALQQSGCYPHATAELQLIETHISWVVLVGPFAYKLKKALNLGFLDYSTLELRHHYALEELRLNRRTAPELYLEVVAVSGTAQQPQMGGSGEAIEWAVKMRRFGQQQLASHLLAEKQLHREAIEQLAGSIARFHRDAAVVSTGSPFGESSAVYQPIHENFRQIEEHLADEAVMAQLRPLEAWYQQTSKSVSPLLTQRKRDGFVRECHGDLHLGNIVLLDGELHLFDGIEFNENLRYVDVISDIAFLLMDLDFHHCSELGWAFLDHYMQESGDYAGLALLRFYQVYRAMVRAKVTAIRMAQQGLSEELRQALRAEVDSYLQLALRYTDHTTPQLVMTHGLSGSGKSSVARQLLAQWGAVRLRSDVERKRLFGMAANQASGSTLGSGIYSAEASQRTYQHLAQLTARLIDAGFNVIVDAAFLRRSERRLFITLAEQRGLPWYLLAVSASEEVLRQRIIQRHALRSDASEADLAVLQQQIDHYVPIGDDELPHLFQVQTDGEWSVVTFMERLAQNGN